MGIKYEGCRKPEHCQAANAVIINKWMDQDLPLLVDIATCFHDYIQASLRNKPAAPAATDAPPATPAPNRRLAGEIRRMDNTGPPP